MVKVKRKNRKSKKKKAEASKDAAVIYLPDRSTGQNGGAKDEHTNSKSEKANFLKDLNLDNFDLKSEKVERNINLPQPTQEEMEQPDATNVRVYRENSVEDVDLKELRGLITNSKDIKKITIENVSVKEATRVSLSYEPNKTKRLDDIKFNNLLSSSDRPFQKINLTRLESELNKSFLQGDQSSATATSRPSPEPEEPTAFDDFIERSEQPKEQPKEQNEKKSSGPELVINLPHTSASSKKIDKKRATDNINFVMPEQSDIVADKDYDIEEKIDQHLSSAEKSEVVESDRAAEMRRVEYDKQTLKRKRDRAYKGYYYRAKDHVELFKMGSSYLRDFREGMKNFAFNSVGLKAEREKSVFGVGTFFNYHADINLVIVTPSIEKSFYAEFVKDFKKERRAVLDEDFSYTVHVAKGVELIEFIELGRVERKIRRHSFEDFLNDLVDSYDLILWDLPEIDVLNGIKELYFPVTRVLDNVSLIVGENRSLMHHVQHQVDYFRRYQVKIKGILFNQDIKEEELFNKKGAAA